MIIEIIIQMLVPYPTVNGIIPLNIEETRVVFLINEQLNLITLIKSFYWVKALYWCSY